MREEMSLSVSKLMSEDVSDEVTSRSRVSASAFSVASDRLFPTAVHIKRRRSSEEAKRTNLFIAVTLVFGRSSIPRSTCRVASVDVRTMTDRPGGELHREALTLLLRVSSIARPV